MDDFFISIRHTKVIGFSNRFVSNSLYSQSESDIIVSVDSTISLINNTISSNVNGLLFPINCNVSFVDIEFTNNIASSERNVLRDYRAGTPHPKMIEFDDYTNEF